MRRLLERLERLERLGKPGGGAVEVTGGLSNVFGVLPG
jgi:hypothetical protein